MFAIVNREGLFLESVLKPRVVENVFSREPQVRVALEHVTDQVS